MLAFVGVVTITQLYAFHHYNKILNGSNAGIPVSQSQAVTPNSPKVVQEVNRLTQQFPTTTVSPDGQYAAYVDTSNTLHIRDLFAGKDAAAVSNSYPVVFLNWGANDLVFVGERNIGDLILGTVSASTGTQRVVHTFSGFSANATFKKMTYSALTNDVYILIGSDTASLVYHFDTNGDLTQVDLGGRLIKNIAVTQTQNILYFEDYAAGTFNVLSRDAGAIQLVQRNAALIGVVQTTLFYGQINSSGLVTAVYKLTASGASQLVSSLATPMLAANISITADEKVKVSNQASQTS